MSRFPLPLLPFLALALAAGTPRVPAKPGITYLYTYYDPQGRLRLYSRYGSGAQAMAEDVKLLLNGA